MDRSLYNYYSRKYKITVAAGWYTDNNLPLILEKVQKKLPRRILIHHDNVSPHAAARYTNYFALLDVEILGPPQHSPDLPSCDFYLFVTVEENSEASNSCMPRKLAAFDKAVENSVQEEGKMGVSVVPSIEAMY